MWSIYRKAYMIDQTITVDLPFRKVARKLYEAAIAIVNKPLCLAAAESIAAAAEKGDVAFIITGFPILEKNACETDGPLGAAVFSETLRSMGVKPILVTDDLCVDVVKATSPDTVVAVCPTDNEAEGLLDRHKPSVLIAIERPGANERGEYHTMRGTNISHLISSRTDHLFKRAKKLGIATIAVGDGGNELGCGAIIEAVRKHVPYGAKCQCPCNGSIAAATPADILVIGGTSNWASYGIAACLSLIKELKYEHTREGELQLLKRVISAGAVDGVTGEKKPSVDGLPMPINGLIVDLIWEIANA
ncbi:MAG: DUF4392 domain-containing protein [Candidatus Bathyarchaeia archaeon]